MGDSIEQSSFIGVWQRESLSIEKSEPFEDSNVLWLHAGDYYADLRWPKSGLSQVNASAFAGRAYWNSPKMHFKHEVDLTKEMDQDVGTLYFSNAKLIEQGQVKVKNKVMSFEETWVPLCKADLRDCQVAENTSNTAKGYIVRVGDFIIVILDSSQQFSAAAWQFEKEVWKLLYGLGEIDSLSELQLAFTKNKLPLDWQVRI